MPTIGKRETVSEIRDRLNASGGLILADYRGLTVKHMRALRDSVRDLGVRVSVYKNSLAEIALRELEMPAMGEYLQGPTVFIFTPDDPVATAKALTGFAKEHKVFVFKGGLLDGQVVTAEQVKAIAALPSREELIAKFMGMATSPVRGFMAMANAPAGALARALRAVADQKAAA